jgi:isopenicillin N synthase-like dioxygenase
MDEAILDVDLLRFERGDAWAREAVVDGVRRSLASGFVYTSSDLSETLQDEAYGNLDRFFALGADVKRSCIAAGSHGQSGYTGPLVETAAGHALADWKEMLNWSQPPASDHPLRRRFPHLYPEHLLPEALVPGITEVLVAFHRAIADLQRRFLRVVAPAGSCQARLSVVPFCHPRPWTELAPVAACISAAHPQRYAGLRAADALEEVLYRIKLLEPGAANPA